MPRRVDSRCALTDGTTERMRVSPSCVRGSGAKTGGGEDDPAVGHTLSNGNPASPPPPPPPHSLLRHHLPTGASSPSPPPHGLRLLWTVGCAEGRGARPRRAARRVVARKSGRIWEVRRAPTLPPTPRWGSWLGCEEPRPRGAGRADCISTAARQPPATGRWRQTMALTVAPPPLLEGARQRQQQRVARSAEEDRGGQRLG